LIFTFVLVPGLGYMCLMIMEDRLISVVE